MKAYVVGGAVRDELLGLPVSDRDWVVVGATPEEMAAAGFRPVGKDFPVFLHPRTHEEYALARTERKSGRGYKGFVVHAAPDVTLEQDLARRDLTINAMARGEAGELIDPFHGARDLQDGVLRHVSEAFAEDPVRILRVARFAARYGFRIADETLALMRRMVAAGETEDLVAERVWQEVARGLAEPHPARMFAVLEQCGALARLFPELRPDADALERAAQAKAPLNARFACLAWPVPEADLRSLCERLRVPIEPRELALTACRCKPLLLEAERADSSQLLGLLKLADAFRRPERFRELLDAERFAEPALKTERIEAAYRAAAAVDAGAIAESASDPAQIARRVEEARRSAIGA
ncbi:MAG TPA: multifunctional CCA tRNA nucleotidyl transferase/2'3'-cyclic phosphodiesterase/2'nucleotidase/phosphatase, partial [Burkholderiales bacterium]|nr:multifunctional CCA tRNA nucleotidyl transferase/2'3'-cyclic phosphodiesterase/2'nucleotidase/phosphatase [Burkholderiales bacterium]